MAEDAIKVRFSLRWWVIPYLQTIIWICETFRIDPDLEKIGRFIAKYGLKVTAP